MLEESMGVSNDTTFNSRARCFNGGRYPRIRLKSNGTNVPDPSEAIPKVPPV
jgi:hypothetical protein